jgi:hypothetical protein
MSTLTKLLAMSLCALLFVACACGDDDDDSQPTRDAGADAADAPDAATDATVADCPNHGQISVPEECNGFDDDCDGEVDEGVCDDPCNDL